MSAGECRLPLETEGCSRSNKAVTAAQFKTYVCRYYHDGKWWGLDIMAPDIADAKARVAKLGNLQLQGELKMTIPVRSGAWLPMTICAIRNTFNSWWNPRQKMILSCERRQPRSASCKPKSCSISSILCGAKGEESLNTGSHQRK